MQPRTAHPSQRPRTVLLLHKKGKDRPAAAQLAASKTSLGHATNLGGTAAFAPPAVPSSTFDRVRPVPDDAAYVFVPCGAPLPSVLSTVAVSVMTPITAPTGETCER